MASTEIEYAPNNTQNQGFGGKVRGAKEYMYNSDTGQVFGRTPKSWALITIFYLVYYTCLAGFFIGGLQIFFLTMSDKQPNVIGMDTLLKGHPGQIVLFYVIYYIALAAFFAACMALFFVTVDDNYPKQRDIDSLIKSNPAQLTIFYLVYYVALAALFGGMLMIFYQTMDDNIPKQIKEDSLIKFNPGMGFRPMPDLDATLVRFEQGKPSSYKIYTDHMQAFLDQYENEAQVGENFIDCSKGKTDDQKEKVCRFHIDTLGTGCTWQTDFGYDEGKPCVLLKLNKVFGWEPETMSNDTKPSIIGDRWDANHIGVTCEGENPADRENIGNITYSPSNGFPVHYYPYLNQEGYRAPIVMVQFNGVTNGVVIQIWCKAWANNIYHHKNDKAGSVHFELLVD